MMTKRCPECGQEVLVTIICGPSAIMLRPCGHEIADNSQLRADGDLDPLSPGEWLTELLADSDDN